MYKYLNQTLTLLFASLLAIAGSAHATPNHTQITYPALQQFQQATIPGKPSTDLNNPLLHFSSLEAEGTVTRVAMNNQAQAFSQTAAAAATPNPSNEDAAIAEAMLNPLSNLWLLFSQNDTYWYGGDLVDDLDEDRKRQNVTLLMPVISQQLTENWKMIFRPVVPIVSYETVDNVDISQGTNPSEGFGIDNVDFERERGLGDIVLWTAFSKQYTPPYIFGFGPTFMLDTASKDSLGTGKFSAGPMALAFSITEKWVIGGVAQHWWSFAGEDKVEVDTNLGTFKRERPDVNLTDFQPVIRYRYSAMTNIGMAPNWRYNWETDQADIPIGLGFDTLVKIGKLPAKIGVEAYYYVEKSDDFGPDFQLRFLFVPVVPSPARSKIPLFK
jgi:hypothetical protein